MSEKWGNEELSLPFHTKLSDNEIKKVCKEIKKFFKRNQSLMSKNFQGQFKYFVYFLNQKDKYLSAKYAYNL